MIGSCKGWLKPELKPRRFVRVMPDPEHEFQVPIRSMGTPDMNHHALVSKGSFSSETMVRGASVMIGLTEVQLQRLTQEPAKPVMLSFSCHDFSCCAVARNGQVHQPAPLTRPNPKPEPREAAPSGSGICSSRNGRLPLAPRSPPCLPPYGQLVRLPQKCRTTLTSHQTNMQKLPASKVKAGALYR